MFQIIVSCGLAATVARAGALPNVADSMLAKSFEQRIEDLELDPTLTQKVRQECQGIVEALNAWEKEHGRQLAELARSLGKAQLAGDVAKAGELNAQVWALVDQRLTLQQEKQENLLTLLTPDQQHYWITQDLYSSALGGATLTGATLTRPLKANLFNLAYGGATEVMTFKGRSKKAQDRDRYNDRVNRELEKFKKPKKKLPTPKQEGPDSKKPDPNKIPDEDKLAPLVDPKTV